MALPKTNERTDGTRARPSETAGARRVRDTAGGRWPKRTAALRCRPGTPVGLFLRCRGGVATDRRAAGDGGGATARSRIGRDEFRPARPDPGQEPAMARPRWLGLAGGSVSRRDGLGEPPFAAAAPADGDTSLPDSETFQDGRITRVRPSEAAGARRVLDTAGGRWPKRTAALRCCPGGLSYTAPGRRCDRPAGRGRGADDGDGRSAGTHPGPIRVKATARPRCLGLSGAARGTSLRKALKPFQDGRTRWRKR